MTLIDQFLTKKKKRKGPPLLNNTALSLGSTGSDLFPEPAPKINSKEPSPKRNITSSKEPVKKEVVEVSPITPKESIETTAPFTAATFMAKEDAKEVISSNEGSQLGVFGTFQVHSSISEQMTEALIDPVSDQQDQISLDIKRSLRNTIGKKSLVVQEKKKNVFLCYWFSLLTIFVFLSISIFTIHSLYWTIDSNAKDVQSCDLHPTPIIPTYPLVVYNPVDFESYIPLQKDDNSDEVQVEENVEYVWDDFGALIPVQRSMSLWESFANFVTDYASQLYNNFVDFWTFKPRNKRL